MISDHLSACLHAETRRKHKIYEDKKTGLLLRMILEDKGDKLAIQDLIAEVTKMAKITVEAQERERRQLAVNVDDGSEE